MTSIDIVLRMQGSGWSAERLVDLPAVPRRDDEFVVCVGSFPRGPDDHHPHPKFGWVALRVTKVRWHAPARFENVEVTLEPGSFDPAGLDAAWDVEWD